MAKDAPPISAARKRALREETPVTVGRFRLEKDRFVRLDGDGDVTDEATTEGLSLALVERRDLGCMVVLLVMAGGIFAGLWAVAGGYGASAAACPVLVLLFLAFMAFLKGDKLEVTTSAKTQVWSIHSDADSLELQILIARVNGALNGAPSSDRDAAESDAGRTTSRSSRSGVFEPHPDTSWYRPGVMEVAGRERHVAVTASSPAQAQHIVNEVCLQLRGAVAGPDKKALPVVMNMNPATLPETDATRALMEAAADEATALNQYRPANPYTVTCTWSVG